ncbi:cupin domain-containing protein [Salinibacterium sp. SYSU T00001]|uniref:cupin domain-containing protein n=1 Tax=Homoserinimonas sedimenticola TaxID=2986805 RepID=UPI0022362167|nr:cupin domain-containing protein [Salinibacterium sedimenticola]MCW4385071.1 cupin domain-containing protein [Salinibacterium sedimenticola]
MTTITSPASVPASELEEKPLAPPSAEPLDGPVTVHSRVDFATEDRRLVSGIWESETGRSRWEFLTRGEIIHVIAGAMTVHEDGGEPLEVRAGDTAYFPIGWCGTWTVTERLRKVFVVYKP